MGRRKGEGGEGNKVPGLLQQIESGGLKREGEREGAAAAMRSLLLSFAANCSWGEAFPLLLCVRELVALGKEDDA